MELLAAHRLNELCHSQCSLPAPQPNNFFITYCTRIGWTSVLLGWIMWRLFFLKDDPDTFGTGRGKGAFSWKYYIKVRVHVENNTLVLCCADQIPASRSGGLFSALEFSRHPTPGTSRWARRRLVATLRSIKQRQFSCSFYPF